MESGRYVMELGSELNDREEKEEWWIKSNGQVSRYALRDYTLSSITYARNILKPFFLGRSLSINMIINSRDHYSRLTCVYLLHFWWGMFCWPFLQLASFIEPKWYYVGQPKETVSLKKLRPLPFLFGSDDVGNWSKIFMTKCIDLEFQLPTL